jgi:hypothetical protein
VDVFEPGALEELAYLVHVPVSEFLLDAVGPEAADTPSHVDARLVD